MCVTSFLIYSKSLARLHRRSSVQKLGAMNQGPLLLKTVLDQTFIATQEEACYQGVFFPCSVQQQVHDSPPLIKALLHFDHRLHSGPHSHSAVFYRFPYSVLTNIHPTGAGTYLCNAFVDQRNALDPLWRISMPNNFKSSPSLTDFDSGKIQLSFMRQ